MVSGLCIQIVIFLKFQWPFCLLARGSPAGFTSRRRQIEEKPEQITRYPCADLNYNRPIVFRHFLWLHISILIHRLGSSSLLPFTMSSSSCSSAYCPKEMADGAELHVLAVDDSVVERMSLERMLKNSAYKVTTAENGVRALEYLGIIEGAKDGNLDKADLKVNLIITDYCMPGMTGYELMRRIKETSYLKEIPVVIMSSENIPTRIEKCLEEGAKEFMLKPIQQSDVKRLRCHVKKMNDAAERVICRTADSY